MKLQGSCYCRKVTFSVESPHPYPFMRCYCSICRKIAGGGGYAINLGAVHDSMDIQGEAAISVFRTADGGQRDSPGERHFCSNCGSALWVWDPRWPELVHPFASAIDTPLPAPPERYHIFQESKPDWVEVNEGPADKCFATYPENLSLAGWHQEWGLEDDG